MIPKKHIEVVAAIIIHDNKILCVQRNENKLEYISDMMAYCLILIRLILLVPWKMF